MPLTREKILAGLRAALEPLEHVYALWEGGAAAFNRVDAWSDIDVMVDVEDERAAEVMALVEQTLAALSPITLKYETPQPAWHGHLQTFFQLQAAGPYLVVDLAVIRHSNPKKFLEPEIHGQALVHFDKRGVVAGAPALDPAALREQIAARRATLRVLFPLFQPLTTKELQRGNLMEAVAFYNGYTLRPLVEVLRMRHCPARYNFHTRYVYYDLPPEAVGRLERLFLPAGLADLTAKQAEAEAWFWELLEAE
ncbi:MAG: hypothetical protein JNK29_12565 [Anaerolineales bacterium]|nr:hypothetical protein [Anaerolineales bacterium]